MTTRPRTAGAAVLRPTSTTTRPRVADAACPQRPLWRARAAPPPRPTIVVEAVNKDSSSGTREEFSLANEDDFASEDDEDEDEEDPERTTVPRARQRAVGRAAAARAEGDTRSDKDANVEANRQALKVGAGGQACKPAGPRVEETAGVQGHRWGAPYGVEEAIWARGGRRSEDYASEVDRGQEDAAHAAATATKTHRTAHARGGT